jgi:hypothetical protein
VGAVIAADAALCLAGLGRAAYLLHRDRRMVWHPGKLLPGAEQLSVGYGELDRRPVDVHNQAEPDAIADGVDTAPFANPISAMEGIWSATSFVLLRTQSARQR